MKTVFITSVCMLIFSTFSFSQTVLTEQQSKASQFLDKSGRLVKKEFTVIDTNFNGCLFQDVQLTDLITNEKISALRIQKITSQGYTRDGIIALLDVDEASGLLKTLQTIKAELPTTPKLYTEITFTCCCGFQLWARFDFKTAKWIMWMQFEKDKDVFLQSGDIDPLIAVMEKAIASMPK